MGCRSLLEIGQTILSPPRTTPTTTSGDLDVTTPSCSNIPTSSKNLCDSRSKMKLDFSEKINIKGDDEADSPTERKFVLVDEENLMQFFRSIARCKCGNKMTVKEGVVEGMAKSYVAKCGQCNDSKVMNTSQGGVKKTNASTGVETCRYDVHNNLVKAALQSSIGYSGVLEWCASLNIHPLSEGSYYAIAKEIENSDIEKLEKAMQSTREQLHALLRDRDGNNNEVKDIRVSCDGSWSKCGFTAMYGFVSVIEITSGLCVDFVVLSKWCKTCTNKEKDNVPPHNCSINFGGSSPAMETEGWRRLWQRSVEKCKFRYVEVVSDGDSKGITAAQKAVTYKVEKSECVNHVAKRLYRLLTEASKKHKLGGNRLGSLTKDKILRLSHYFGEAITDEGTVEDMKKRIYATLRHCMSTDKKPQHIHCPDGETSWCFYKRAIADGRPIPPHKKKMSTYLREPVVAKMMPVYMGLLTDELLGKCKGETQNSNESLHNVIWKELPKIRFFCLRRMEYGIYRGVTKFNLGAATMGRVLGDTGSIAVAIRKKTDRKRLYDAMTASGKKGEQKRRKIKKVREEEEKIAAEGETYGPGIAPLS